MSFHHYSEDSQVQKTSPFNPSKRESTEVAKVGSKTTPSKEQQTLTPKTALSTKTKTPPTIVKTADTNCSTTPTQSAPVITAPIQMMPTPISTAHSPPYLTAVEGLNLCLLQETAEKLKQDFLNRLKAEGHPISAQNQSAMEVIDKYRDGIQKNIKEFGHALDLMIGSRLVLAGEAQKAVEQVVSMGIISTEEVIVSSDCEQIANADGHDVISIHSLANVVRKILNGRK